MVFMQICFLIIVLLLVVVCTKLGNKHIFVVVLLCFSSTRASMLLMQCLATEVSLLHQSGPRPECSGSLLCHNGILHLFSVRVLNSFILSKASAQQTVHYRAGPFTALLPFPSRSGASLSVQQENNTHTSPSQCRVKISVLSILVIH